MENWVMTMKKADFNSLAKALHITPVTARLLRNRDLPDESAMREYLYGTVNQTADPHLMRDLDHAASILLEKIQQGKRIRIIGDYDIDGVNAVYILLRGLNGLGACVDYDIPDRMRDGYGVNPAMIEQASSDGIDTILTCDNGIAAMDAVLRAKELGMTVIVTDHHQIPYVEENDVRILQLPPADAVVDPHHPECRYPYKGICGAVVARKLVQVLYESAGCSATCPEELIENAAIATIGDVMDLTGENRLLVREGLKRLSRTQNPGLSALIRVCGLENTVLTAYHIGFVLGPCINATGRLDSAKRALELLNCRDPKAAMEIALDLKALNDSRKVLTDRNVDQAIQMIENTELHEDRVLVVYLPDCHESLAGIIAGRLRERYYKPAIVLTRGETCVKGSGRSIESYSMFEELSACRELLLKFGGHPMAAGLSLEESHVETLRRKLNELCTLTEQELCPKVTLDMLLPFAYATETQIDEFSLLEPYGKGNRKPLFALRNVRTSRPQILGKTRRACKLLLTDEYGAAAEGIYFGDADAFCRDIQERETIDIAYYPEINEFRGKRTVQMTIQHYR